MRSIIDVSLPLIGLVTYGWLSLILVLVVLDYLLGAVLSREESVEWSAIRIAAAFLLVALWLYSWWRLAIYVRNRLQGR